MPSVSALDAAGLSGVCCCCGQPLRGGGWVPESVLAPRGGLSGWTQQGPDCAWIRAVPGWATKVACFCWSIFPLSVRVPRDRAGSCLGAAWLSPLRALCQQLLAIVGKETSLRGREMLFGRKGCPQEVLAGAFCLLPPDSTGWVPPRGCTAGSCCTTWHLRPLNRSKG